MRIISGSCRGRRLLTPGSRFAARVRPTSDRAREALFQIIRERVTGARVLDLFAGTGALALEALSRGAASALLVEQDAGVLELARRNIELCGFVEVARPLRRDCGGRLDFLAHLAPAGGFSLVFLDPPYGRGLAAKALSGLAAAGVLAPDALVVAETGRQEELPEFCGPLSRFDHRLYGEAALHLFARQETATSATNSTGEDEERG